MVHDQGLNWKQEIAKLVYIKQALADVDTRHIYPHHLPKVRASLPEIVECERRLGFRLNSEHRNFLQCANGWDGFVQSTNLFGTADFSGSSRFRAAQNLLDAYEKNVFANANVTREGFFPIANSELDGDIFIMTRDGYPGEGRVLWFAGYLIDQYPSFSEFFLSMMDYNREGITKLRN